jgi:hypothetical protein
MYRARLLDNRIVQVGIALFSFLTTGAVALIAREQFSVSRAASATAGIAALVPGYLVAYFVVYYIDRNRGPHQFTSTHGVTLSGLLYVEAGLLGLCSTYRLDGEGINWAVSVTPLLLALACAVAGRTAKKHRRARKEIAKLAQSHVSLATRFMVRPDVKGWPEIQPFSVMAYQRRFEKALSEIGSPLPASRLELTGAQAERMIQAARDGEPLPRREDHDVFDTLSEIDHHNYPEVVVSALVLAFLDAKPEQRKRERAEWAAAVATRVNASRIRDALQP